MIHVIATVQLKPGTRTQFLSNFREVVPLVLREPGCLAYSSTVDLATDIAAQAAVRENVVTVVEQWESIDHLQEHLVAPHMLAYRQRVKPCVESVSLQILTPV
jgi:quinol monooxygenase YgiN